MLEYHQEPCSERPVLLGASLFCPCGTPFVERYRHVPCHHVLCSTCALRPKTRDKCPLCKARSDSLELIHPNDAVYVCTAKGCNRGFLNFPSLRAHGKIAHDIDAESVVDYYAITGDIKVQFGNVHKIAHETARVAHEASHEELEPDEPPELPEDPKPKRQAEAREKPARAVDAYQARQHDDLEGLM